MCRARCGRGGRRNAVVPVSTRRTLGPGRAEIACLAAIIAVWLLLWWPVLVEGELFYMRDLVFFTLPVKQYLAERIAAGELPLWTPHISAGMPFLGDAANQVFYPFNLLLLVLSPERAIAWSTVLHSGIGMLGAFALARALGAARGFALWAGLGYALSGYVLSITDNLNYVAGAAWLPVALACYVRSLRSASVRRAATAALAIAMLLLAGDALAAGIASAGAALLGLAALAGWWGAPGEFAPRGARPVLFAWLLMIGGGALLAGLQVAPTLMLIGTSTRAGGVSLQDATQFSLPPARLLEFVQAYLFGAKYPALEFFAGARYDERNTPWAASIYIGLAPLLAALLAAWLRPRHAWPWLLLGGLLTLLALGRNTPVYEWAYTWLPMVDSQRYPEKLVLGVTLAVWMLAPLGAQAALAGPLSRRLPRPAYLAITAGIVLLGFVLTLWTPVRSLLGENARVESFFFSDMFGVKLSHMQGLALHTAAVSGVLIAGLALHAWRPAAAFVLVGVLTLVDLARINAPAAPTAAPETLALDRPPALLDAVPALIGSRILYEWAAARGDSEVRLNVIGAHFSDIPSALRGGIYLLEVVRRSREALTHNEGLRFGVDYVNGLYSPLQPRAASFLERVLVRDDTARYVALTSVDYILTSPTDTRWPASAFETVYDDAAVELRVLRPLHTPPRALLVPNAVVFAGPVEAGRDVIFSIDDFRRRLILDPADGEVPVFDEQAPDERAQARLSRPSAERIVVDVVSPYRHAWLRVDESFSPGWTARIDGEPARVRRADFRAMAVAVPAGTHEVVLEYHAPGLGAGFALSGAGVLLLLLTVRYGGVGPRRAQADA